jgi:ABC-2 type transport system ATP-binding protein
MHIVSSITPSIAAAAPAAIEISQLSFGFVSGTDVLCNVTAAVPVGATCALFGPNGAGKSTLMEVIAGLRVPRSGALRVHGALVTGTPSARPDGVALVSSRALPPVGFTIAELLRYVAAWHPRWNDATADALLRQFALSARQRIETLSFGGRMKVQLLCALAAQPQLLLLDEPFVGLDVATKDALIGGLLSVDDGAARTTLIASHDLAEMELLVDHVIVLDGGRVRLTGELDALRSGSARATTLRDLYVSHTEHSTTRMEPAA